MKKKIFIGIAMSLFAVATVFNIKLNKNDTEIDLQKANIMAIAHADGEVVIGRMCATYIDAFCAYDDGYWANGFWV